MFYFIYPFEVQFDTSIIYRYSGILELDKYSIYSISIVYVYIIIDLYIINLTTRDLESMV